MIKEEKIMREVCAEMGVEVIEGRGSPTLNGIEITETDISKLFNVDECIADKWIENINTLWNTKNLSEWQKNYLKTILSIQNLNKEITDKQRDLILNKINLL